MKIGRGIARGCRTFSWLVIGLLTMSPPTGATVTAVDPLQRSIQSSGDVETWVTTQFRPGGEKRVVSVGGKLAQLVEREHQWTTQLGVAYSMSEKISFWSEWTLLNRHRQTLLQVGDDKEVQHWSRSQSAGVVGLRHRWAPSSPFDPQLGVSVSSVGSTHVDVSIARIVDPSIVLLRIGRSFPLSERSSGAGAGVVDISAGFGLVVNEKMTLFLGLGYSQPQGIEEIDSANLSMRWTWQIDPRHQQSIGVWGALTQIGGSGGVGFGLEWNHRFTRAHKS